MTPTPREIDTARVIATFWADHGMPPTLRQVAEGLGINIATAHHHVRGLRQLGIVQPSKPWSHRSIVFTEQGRKLFEATEP